MLRIEKESREGTTRLLLSGRIRSDRIACIRSAMNDSYARKSLDLGEVTLVDVAVVQFLIRCEDEGIDLLQCPPWVRQWMLRERARYLKVHHLGPTDADVTEGSGGVWERLHYDWSHPNHVVLTTTDSNIWGGASGHTYNFTKNPNGTTDIDVDVVREGKNLKGRVRGLVLRTIGRGVSEKAFENSVKAIEARNDAARRVA